MLVKPARRHFLQSAAALGAVAAAGLPTGLAAQDRVRIRMSGTPTATDQRAIAVMEVFAPAVSDFADFEAHWASTLFRQGTELEAIARGNLEMSITSAQELAEFFPEFSIFTAGYMHRDAEHQVRVFESEFMEPFKQRTEEELGVKLLAVMYLGRRHVNLRGDREVRTPADLAGVRLRMPTAEAWQFLGTALGANPVPIAFAEVYTALQTGAIDGQDNPLPTNRDSRFYEVTDQIVLTSHLVDLNYLAMSAALFDSLTEEQQQIVMDAARETAELARQRQLALEEELVAFFEEQGLRVYEPDLEAFRTHVQEQYLNSPYSETWPEGAVDAINAL